MKVSELGEFGLIDLLAKMLPDSYNRQLIVGIGDDAAAWQSDDSIQLATTDSLFQDIHFSLDTINWQELGWKALAVNLSDIAAMGGTPTYALVSLALPENTEVEGATALYRGMIELAQQFKVDIIGGDTCRAPLVSITITVLGSTKSHGTQILTRSTAKSGEKIAVTGYIGSSAAGLNMLSNDLQLSPEATAYLRNAFVHPQPQITEGLLLVEQGVKTCIDISDGLVADLHHICRASNAGARVEIDRLPVHHLVKDNFREKAMEIALSGGEDYELLFTASDEVIEKVKSAASCPVTVVGEITTVMSGKVTLVDKKGKPFNLRKAGWDHFTAR